MSDKNKKQEEKVETVNNPEVSGPEKLIDETFEKASESVNTKLDENQQKQDDVKTSKTEESKKEGEENIEETGNKSEQPDVEEVVINESTKDEQSKSEDELPEQLNEYSLLNLEEGDAHLAVESIVKEESLDLTKDSVQLAMKLTEKDDIIYYRFDKGNTGEWTEWEIYATVEIEEPKLPKEGLDAEIERILKEEHYFSFSSVGRHIINGDYDENSLKEFYEEFKASNILINKNHYDLMELFKQKFD